MPSHPSAYSLHFTVGRPGGILSKYCSSQPGIKLLVMVEVMEVMEVMGVVIMMTGVTRSGLPGSSLRMLSVTLGLTD